MRTAKTLSAPGMMSFVILIFAVKSTFNSVYLLAVQKHVRFPVDPVKMQE